MDTHAILSFIVAVFLSVAILQTQRVMGELDKGADTGEHLMRGLWLSGAGHP